MMVRDCHDSDGSGDEGVVKNILMMLMVVIGIMIVVV